MRMNYRQLLTHIGNKHIRFIYFEYLEVHLTPWPAVACDVRKLRSAPSDHTKSDADDQTERQTARQTDRQKHGHISSTGPHWGPPDPSVGIIYTIYNKKTNCNYFQLVLSLV